MTRYTGKSLRKAILEQGELDFEFWLRVYRDGSIWTAPTNKFGNVLANCHILMERLRVLGLEPSMKGKPGTSGAFIVETAKTHEYVRQTQPKLTRRRSLNG